MSAQRRLRQLRTLFGEASGRQLVNRLRSFLAAVEDRARHDVELATWKQQWIEWARAKAERLDPLEQHSDPILDTTEPDAPSS